MPVLVMEKPGPRSASVRAVSPGGITHDRITGATARRHTHTYTCTRARTHSPAMLINASVDATRACALCIIILCIQVLKSPRNARTQFHAYITVNEIIGQTGLSIFFVL